MDFRDIVKLTVFLTDTPLHSGVPRGARQDVGQEPYPASTLLVVAGLADPSMLSRSKWSRRNPEIRGGGLLRLEAVARDAFSCER